MHQRGTTRAHASAHTPHGRAEQSERGAPGESEGDFDQFDLKRFILSKIKLALNEFNVADD